MKQNVLVLFDIDGTLTTPRGKATNEMLDKIKELRNHVYVGVVGGSDLIKQEEQLGRDILTMFDYSFPENGLIAYKEGIQIHKNSIVEYLGEDKYKKIVNYILKYISECNIPIKRGTFIELRTGLINVSLIGRNCSLFERNEYEKYDVQYSIRKNLINKLKYHFDEYNLRYSIGGQISFDVFPFGWDKTYCLQHIEDMNFMEIHFFGDKTKEGENDYEIYNDERVIGHHVDSPNDTIQYIKKMLLELNKNKIDICKDEEDKEEVKEKDELNISGEKQYLICEDDQGNVYKITQENWDQFRMFASGITTLCPNCKVNELEYDYCNMKDCEGCEKSVCINCVALTGCQTTWGICKKCFDYKCEICEKEVLDRSQNMCYLVDDEPSPKCEECIKKKESETSKVNN